MKHFIFTTRQHVMEDVSLKVPESEAEKIFDNDLAEELLLGTLDDSSIEAVENIYVEHTAAAIKEATK